MSPAEMQANLALLLRGRAPAGQYALWYLALLLVACAWYVLSWPIVAVDGDLWYHLAAGRYMVAEGAIPDHAFFSFVEPTPEYLDYSWLSQLLFYGTHAFAGYTGLVGLRALAVFGTLGGVLALLRLGRGRQGQVYTALVFTLVALFLLARFAPLRPHDWSLLLIVGFLLLLESRRGLAALPILALFWVNLHGVEYPVMVLVSGAYLGEWLLARLGFAPAVEPARPRDAALVVLAILCVLATPHGLSLLAVPFTSLTFAAQYIDELRPLEPVSLLTLRLDGLLVSRDTLLALLLGLASTAALLGVRPGVFRPSHLVLFAGGGFLLLRVDRFSSEFVLLVLPLLASLRPPSGGLRWLPLPVRAVLLIGLAVLPFRFLSAFFDLRCTFPLCGPKLPSGAVAFLARAGATGAVFHHPNHGGYLEWELFPRQKLFADLRTPFFFSDRTIFRADQAFFDPVVLAGVLGEYEPEFLLVPRPLQVFRSLISRHAEYAPVFVDDGAVLYASRRANPQLVAEFELSSVEPFSMTVRARGDVQQLTRARQELSRMLEIKLALATGLLAGRLALDEADAHAALQRADELIRIRPGSHEPFLLRGDVLTHQGRFDAAARAYEQALENLGNDRGAAAQRSQLQSQLWGSYSWLGRNDRAYDSAKRAIGNLYRPVTGYRELFFLGAQALKAGRLEEGRTLLGFALLKAPPDKTKWRDDIQALLRGGQD